MVRTREGQLQKDFVIVSRTRVRLLVRMDGQQALQFDLPSFQAHKSFRAARLVDDSTRFLIVTVAKSSVGNRSLPEPDLDRAILQLIQDPNGFIFGDSKY